MPVPSYPGRPDDPRYAVYYVPPEGAALYALGSRLLGRCCRRGEALEQPSLPGIPGGRLASATGKAALYGFHATLVAPFRPAVPEAALAEALAGTAGGLAPVAMPRLRAAVLRGSFAALVPEAPPPGLAGLEERLVKSLRPLARDPDPGDAARRGPLTERQAMNLTRWGYPFVLSDFSFHMSLAYTAEESFLSVLEGYLPPEALAPFPLDSVSLCLQTGPGRPFRVLADFPLRGAAGR